MRDLRAAFTAHSVSPLRPMFPVHGIAPPVGLTTAATSGSMGEWATIRRERLGFSTTSGDTSPNQQSDKSQRNDLEEARMHNVCQNETKNEFSWWWVLVLLACIWCLIGLETGQWNTYSLLDDSGWIEHNHETPVWIKGEWLAGEYRVCQMPLLPGQQLPDSAHLLCGQGKAEALKNGEAWTPDFIGILSDHEFMGLMAGKWSSVEQHFHVIPVSYWGNIDRTDRRMFSWRCQRETESLNCKPLT